MLLLDTRDCVEFLSIFLLSKTNVILKFNHENGSMKMCFTGMFCIFVSLIHSLTHEMATKVNGRNIHVNCIVLAFLKCPTHGMSPPCYQSCLSE